MRISTEEIHALSQEIGRISAFAKEGPMAYMSANRIAQKTIADLSDQRDIKGLESTFFGAGYLFNRKPTPEETVEATLMQLNLYGELWAGSHALLAYLNKMSELLSKEMPDQTRAKIADMTKKLTSSA